MQLDMIKVQVLMQEKISQLDKKTQELECLSQKRAEMLSLYDKELATTIVKLKNGIEFILDGEKIINPVNTINEKIAKGIIWKTKLNMETAEYSYKNCIKIIQVLQAQLDGYRSMNKYLDITFKQ